MNEKLLESWLSKANERTFQIPFCHSLTKDGYTVLHLSRHCAMEMGKDIIAIDPTGTPCAFQLKGLNGGKMSLSRWNEQLALQIYPLVHYKLKHPSLRNDIPHRPIIVVNGQLEEEVIRAIEDFNTNLPANVLPLETIVFGELMNRFKALGAEFWPSDVSIEYTYLLEFFLEDGAHNLDKPKFATLLERSIQIDNAESISVPKASLMLGSAALLTSAALAPFSAADNHLAEIQGWTIFFGCAVALIEKHEMEESAWKLEMELASQTLFNSLGRLVDEVIAAKSLLQPPSVLLDRLFLDARRDHLVGLFSVYALWRKAKNIEPDKVDEFLRVFCIRNAPSMSFEGEYAAPLFFATHLFRQSIDPSPASEQQLASVLGLIARRDKENPIQGPYVGADECWLKCRGFKTKRLSTGSYIAESFVHLLVRNGMKQTLKQLWASLTRLDLFEFVPDPVWGYMRWRCPKGTTHRRSFPCPTSWRYLSEKAHSGEVNSIPTTLTQFPCEFLLFLIVFPHRLTPSAVHYLDSSFDRVRK